MIKKAQESLTPKAQSRSFFIECMIFLLVMLIASVPQSIATTIAATALMIADPEYNELILSGNASIDAINEYTTNFISNLPGWYYALSLATAGFMTVAAIVYCRSFEKRSAYSMGFVKKGAVLEYLAGAVIGAVMISVPVLISVATGALTLTLSPSVDYVSIAIFFGAFILQGMGEEVLFRGYFMTSIARKHHVWFAVIASSLTFAIFHVGNAAFSIIAFINIALFGIFAAVYMLKRGSIWGVCAIHSVWNFAQGNVFGLNVSGHPKFSSVFVAENADFGAIMSGGAFGPEGGIGATLVLMIGILIVLLMPTKACELTDEAPEAIKINDLFVQ